MISFIVAMDQQRVIGRNNELPWHLPADLQFFKKVTMGYPIIMGRKTFESIGRPLPGRRNIILTRNQEYVADGCEVINTMEQLEDVVKGKDEYFIIGGAELFNRTLHMADRLYITEIDESFEGDTYFPEIRKNEWQLVSKEKGIKDEKNPYDYFFCVYERK